jgi:ubiquinone/menaquinone biosynthesis C-methylase UbiE
MAVLSYSLSKTGKWQCASIDTDPPSLRAFRLSGDHLLTQAFDRVAPTFDDHRALPAGVIEAVRSAIVTATAPAHPPRYLDLGAGSGRFGSAFVTAGDDYVGVDLSAGMLRAFAHQAAQRKIAPRLVQADGANLPFRDRVFDTVLLMNVFGGLRDWRQLIAEVRRVLHPGGAVVVGKTKAPPDGLDARMKQRARDILGALDVAQDRVNRRDEVVRSLASDAMRHINVTAARWTAKRTPRGFIARHRDGARFADLPQATKTQAMRELGAWAVAQFGSLDSIMSEQHAIALDVFTLAHGAAG